MSPVDETAEWQRLEQVAEVRGRRRLRAVSAGMAALSLVLGVGTMITIGGLIGVLLGGLFIMFVLTGVGLGLGLNVLGRRREYMVDENGADVRPRSRRTSSDRQSSAHR